jgi:hypothetical protein
VISPSPKPVPITIVFTILWCSQWGPSLEGKQMESPCLGLTFSLQNCKLNNPLSCTKHQASGILL